MSRAINLSVAEADVAAMCERRNITISAIESLQGGGTRVVLMNADDTAVIAREFRTKIITGAVIRVPFYDRRH